MTAHRYSTKNQPSTDNRRAIDRTIRKLTVALEATDDPQMMVQLADRLTKLLEMREQKRKERQDRKKINSGLLGHVTPKVQTDQPVTETKPKQAAVKSDLLYGGSDHER